MAKAQWFHQTFAKAFAGAGVAGGWEGALWRAFRGGAKELQEGSNQMLAGVAMLITREAHQMVAADLRPAVIQYRGFAM